MGCFLTITQKDFAQLESTLKPKIRIRGYGSSTVHIEVTSTAYSSAKQMANEIRRGKKSTRMTRPGEKIKSTRRFMRELVKQVSSSGSARYLMGTAVGEPAAARILEQRQNLTILEIARGRGPDIKAKTISGYSVLVEVKTSSLDDSFPDLLEKGLYKKETGGKGCKQCSDKWFEINGIKNPDKASIRGVRIHPQKQTVSLYLRRDSDANNWKHTGTFPLSKYI